MSSEKKKVSTSLEVLAASFASLRLLGIWNHREENSSNGWKRWRLLYIIYTTINCCTMVFFFTSAAVNLKQSSSNVQQFADNLIISIVTVHALAKVLPLVLLRERVRRCLGAFDAVAGPWGLAEKAYPSAEQNQAAVRSASLLLWRFTITMHILAATSAGIWVLFPLLVPPMVHVDPLCDRNSTLECDIYKMRPMSFAGWFPFETRWGQRGYWVAFAFQVLAAFFNSMNTCGANSLYLGLMYCATLALRALGAALRDLPPHDLTRLRELLRRHNLALDYVEEVSALLGPIMFIHSLGMSMLLCTSVLLLTTGLDSIKFVAVGIFALYETTELFMYCMMGTEIQTVSVVCGIEAYNSPWYEAPTSSKRSVQMLLLRAQRAAKIRAAGFTTLSLDLFTSLMRLSYSFYALLRQMTD